MEVLSGKYPGADEAKVDKFCMAYLETFSQKAAAKAVGISARSAQIMLEKEHVQERLVELKNIRLRRANVDASFVLKRLYESCEADVSELFDEDGAYKHPRDWPEPFRKGLVSSLNIEARGGDVSVTRLRLADRTKLLELLGRHIDVAAFEVKDAREDAPIEGSVLPPRQEVAKRTLFLLRKAGNE